MNPTQWIVLVASLGGLASVAFVFVLQSLHWRWPRDLVRWEGSAHDHKVSVLMSKSLAVVLDRKHRDEIAYRCCLGVQSLHRAWLERHSSFSEEDKGKLRQLLGHTCVMFLDTSDFSQRWIWGEPYPKAFTVKVRKKFGRSVLLGSIVRLDLLEDVLGRVHPLEHELTHHLLEEFYGTSDHAHQMVGMWDGAGGLKQAVSTLYQTQLLKENRPVEFTIGGA